MQHKHWSHQYYCLITVCLDISIHRDKGEVKFITQIDIYFDENVCTVVTEIVNRKLQLDVLLINKYRLWKN